MRDDYDFTDGVRGKFHSSEATFRLPIYLDDEAMAFVEKIAKRRNIDVSEVVNQLIHTDRQLTDITG